MKVVTYGGLLAQFHFIKIMFDNDRLKCIMCIEYSELYDNTTGAMIAKLVNSPHRKSLQINDSWIILLLLLQYVIRSVSNSQLVHS